MMVFVVVAGTKLKKVKKIQQKEQESVEKIKRAKLAYFSVGNYRLDIINPNAKTENKNEQNHTTGEHCS